jgi:archaellum component FlaC
MDSLKDAFQRVKKDIDSLKYEIDNLKKTIKELNNYMGFFGIELKKMREKSIQDFIYLKKNLIQSPTNLPTNRQIAPTNATILPTHQQPFKPLKPENQGISTGNEGVPTDRQTDRQTDRHIEKPLLEVKKEIQNPIQDAAKILDSLDSLKKEIRLKFKRLTEKEMLVFSTLYQLDDEIGYTDYKSLASKLNLTESSIRDYVLRLISKGIPVDKKKINNKQVQLSISQDLKKIAPLQTILQLRDL